MDAFLLYIDDWLGSTHIAAMDAAEERGYLRLLLHAAKQDDCGLPNDPGILARLSKLDSRWKRGSGDVILQCFFERDGRLYNKRLLAVHHEFLERKKRRQLAAEQRWKKAAEDKAQAEPSISNADALHKQSTSNADAQTDALHDIPIPIPIPNGKSIKPSFSPDSLPFDTLDEPIPEKEPEPDWDSEHDRFYYTYWRHVDKQASLKAFRKLVPALMKERGMAFSDTVEFLIEQVASDRARWENTPDWEWRKNLHPATWQNGRRWEDESLNGGTSSPLYRPLM